MQIGFEESDVVAQYEGLLAQQVELTKQAEFMSSLLSDVKSTSEKYFAIEMAKREKALAEYEQVNLAVTKLKETLETTTLDLTEQVEQGWSSRVAVDEEFAKFVDAHKSYVAGMSLKAKAIALSSEMAEIRRIYEAQQDDAKRQELAEAVTEAERQFDEIEMTHKVTRELTRQAFGVIKPISDEAEKMGLNRGCPTRRRIAALWARYNQLKSDVPIVTMKPENKMTKAVKEATKCSATNSTKPKKN